MSTVLMILSKLMADEDDWIMVNLVAFMAMTRMPHAMKGHT